MFVAVGYQSSGFFLIREADQQRVLCAIALIGRSAAVQSVCAKRDNVAVLVGDKHLFCDLRDAGLCAGACG